MADLNEAPKDGEPPPTRRARAPTITIDTAVNSSSPTEMATESQGQTSNEQPSQDDEAVSPSTTVDPLAASWASSQKSHVRPELRAETSFESKDSRPTSPHNISSPVTSRGTGPPTFLSVPSNLRSRQDSMDSEDASRSVASSQAETTVAGSSSQTTGAKKRRSSGELSNDKVVNDDDALKPDPGKEGDFVVENNPFAFAPGQLNKLLNPKSLAAFYKLGGLSGIERGLRSNRKAGLSAEEHGLSGTVAFEEVTQPSKLATEATVGDYKEAERRPSTSLSRREGGDDPFSDRKRVFCDNRLPEKKGKSLLQLMWITYQDKVLMLLSAAAVVSLAVGLYQTFGLEHDPGEAKVEWIEGVAIIAAIAIVVIVGSLNDYQKERQFAKLNRRKQDRLVKVIRSGRTQEISVYDVLAGDVVHLEPGDLVPVDGVLIEGFNVKCDESSVTGESDIIKKKASDDVYEAIRNKGSLKKLDPFIMSGSRIMEGVGTFMCTSTGIHSTYGRTLMALNDDPEITPLQSKLNVIAEYIAKIGGAAGLLLFIVLFIQFLARLPNNHKTPAGKGQEFIEIFIVVVTIIVVAVPEGLPLAVTLALAFATTRMIKDNNLVRHLKACEVMGNATTICSDKTGTLTQNKMQVVAGTVGTSHRFGGVARPPTPAEDDQSVRSIDDIDTSEDVSATEFAATLKPEVKELIMKSVALNSTAFESEVDGKMTFIGSKTETALLLFAREHLSMGPVSVERENATTLQLIPFDSGRKCMGIVVAEGNGRARLFVKGASEIVLAKCTQMIRDPSSDLSLTPMTNESQETVSKLINHYASRSLRTIGIAYRDFERWPPRAARRADGDKDEISFDDLFHNMVFIGMVGIQDPLREGVPEAVHLCQKAGVVVRMVTGDNRMTARAIAQECGILQPNSIIMEGPEFRILSKFEQEQVIPRLHVLARSSPEDKRILVKRLKEKGDIVAVTGDGTNDAPALKMADVGFSMGIAGTEVAKEASAIILMDDNFNSIVKALKWGRAVNDAVKRFLQFQLTVNVTAVILTFVTAVSNHEESSVLTAVQLLWVNLIMDTLAALALATDPPQDSILNRKPERRNASIISTTMWKMILGQAIYQLVITLIIYYGGDKVLPEPGGGRSMKDDATLSTLVFNTFVWMQIFNQWNNRRLDNHFNILEGITKNWIFPAINLIMCGMQVMIIFATGPAFQINPAPPGSKDPQGPVLWAIAIILGFVSIPFGMVIRLVPDRLLEELVPDYLKRKAQASVPGLTVSDEEAQDVYPSPLTEVRDELAFLKRVKGGRLNNLKFAMRHPRETFKQRSRSPSHSRTSSIKTPQTPTREDSFGSAVATPESRRRSKSMRSRSNSALGAPTVMAGLVAAGVAAAWSPIDHRERAEREESSREVTEEPGSQESQGPSKPQ